MWKRLREWWGRNRQARMDAVQPEGQVVVEVGAAGISVRDPSGAIQAIAWDDVECVAIDTNDSGPWGADLWWVVEGRGRRCAYPQGATGESEAMHAFGERLAGFSHEAVIEANGSTSNARFVCWQRAGATSGRS